MNTHKILVEAGYSSKDNYPEIAKFAAGVDGDVLAAVAEKFGEPDKLLESKPYAVFGAENIEDGALKQMDMVMSLPVAVRGALMPDAHQGYAMPIGGVVALENTISPSFVGYDIACRMKMTVLDMDKEDVDVDTALRAMLDSSSFGKGACFEEPKEHEVMDDTLWDELPHLKSLKPLARSQLGSSGGGNHFFDLMFGEWEFGGDFVAIMTHSGSRGIGHKMASHYMKLAKRKNIPSGYGWLDLNSELGQEYLAVMRLMGRYASACHELIHRDFCTNFGVLETMSFENHHNFAWLDGDMVIHRKGATPAGIGDIGIIPGSSGTASYLVEGKGNPDSLNSSSHGAGRVSSRTQAKKNHNESLVSNWMSDKGIVTYGVAPDESFMAYKDIEQVMNAQKDLVKPLGTMYPKIVVMGSTTQR